LEETVYDELARLLAMFIKGLVQIIFNEEDSYGCRSWRSQINVHCASYWPLKVKDEKKNKGLAISDLETLNKRKESREKRSPIGGTPVKIKILCSGLERGNQRNPYGRGVVPGGFDGRDRDTTPGFDAPLSRQRRREQRESITSVRDS